MANRFATKHQWGLEAVNGTAVAADTMLMCAPRPLNPDRALQRAMDASGLRAPSNNARHYGYLVQDTLNFDADHPLYFQILPMLFSIGLKGNITPTEQTVGQGDYLWAFGPALTGSNSLDSITLEEGDDTQAYEVEYVMAERFQISGDVVQDTGVAAVNMAVDFFGRQRTATSFTGSIALPTVEFLNANAARLYKDSAWAGVGGTELAGILRGFDVEIITGVHHKRTGSANNYFTTHGQSYVDFNLALTLERGAAADAIWDDMNAKTFRVLRLAIEGSQIGTGDNQSLIVDFGGYFDQVVPVNAEDRGNNLDAAVFVSKYDATGAKHLDVNVTTDVAAI